jgi:hypothetical protein
VIRLLKRDAKPPRRDASGRALRQADKLFARGDTTTAIELLMDANRSCRDPRIERRLVMMRFDGFHAAQWPGVPPAVPTDAADLFPGATIPEIGPDDFDVDHVWSGLLNHGSLLVRGLVGPEQIERLRSDIDRALDAYDVWRAGDAPGAVPWFEPFPLETEHVERNFRRKSGAVIAADSPAALFDVIETFDAVGIRKVMNDFFGEPPALLAKKWSLRRVPHDRFDASWHQDGAFMGGDIRSLNVWLALSHCGDDAPGLDVVARRLDDIVPTGTEGTPLPWTVAPDVVERVAPGAVVRPIFEPGDVLVFDHFNLHKTATEPHMIRDRYAIEAWFLAPSTYRLMIDDERKKGVPPRDQLPMIY